MLKACLVIIFLSVTSPIYQLIHIYIVQRCVDPHLVNQVSWRPLSFPHWSSVTEEREARKLREWNFYKNIKLGRLHILKDFTFSIYINIAYWEIYERIFVQWTLVYLLSSLGCHSLLSHLVYFLYCISYKVTLQLALY